MQREIKIPYTQDGSIFLGRNGEGQQHGIALFRTLLSTPSILLEPIRKNGQMGRASLEIPLADIPALITALQNLYAEHAPAPTPVPEPEQSEVDGSKPEIVLEVGKKYLTRNGLIFTVWNIDNTDPYLPVEAEDIKEVVPYFYTINGSIGRNDYTEPHSLDLVAEYKEPKEWSEEDYEDNPLDL